MQPPPDTSFDFRLRDDTMIRVRPVQPEDKERLQEGLRHLSSESRYLRFMGGKKSLSQQELRYFPFVFLHAHQQIITRDACVIYKNGWRAEFIL